MKKIITFLFLVVATQISFSQSYKILNTAAGKLENFVTLTDGDELYGYAELRQLDELSPTEVKFKYIILDKNMNTINSGEFVETKVKKKCVIENYQIVYNNGHILFNFIENFVSEQLFINIKFKYKILGLAANKITASGTYDKSIKPDDNNIPKMFKNVKYYAAAALSNSGFFVQLVNFDKKKDESACFAIDFNGEQLWASNVKQAEEKHEYEYQFFEMDENTLSFIATKSRGSKKVSDHLLILDTKTGKEISFTNLYNDTYTLLFSFSKINDEKLTIIGRYFEKEKRDRVEYDESLGLYKREIDMKSGKIISEIFLPYSKFNFKDISENGKVKGEGILDFRKIDQNPDGSFFMIAETFRAKSKHNLYFELYVFQIDKDFNSISTKSFDTEKSFKSKYRFSQELLGNAGKVYFFYDKNEDKKLELNLIDFNFSSKEITLSKMNLNTTESKITVFPAKTGYVAIKEEFTNPKKGESQIEIRLEKLNYERQ
ncbi:DUF6770 family protein [Flavobacterium ardleyense]|uniref:DUF6770 family protein n=1 Tax=Flavobacterium ardleyense TaxID=2038737 RepID=A0ABW5Z795_9FLAO